MPTTPDGRPIRLLDEPPIPTVYANATSMMYGLYDFRVMFSEQMVDSDGAFVQVDRVAVAMSPQHMKKLTASFSEKIVEYERKFGVIPEAEEEENAPPAATD